MNLLAAVPTQHLVCLEPSWPLFLAACAVLWLAWVGVVALAYYGISFLLGLLGGARRPAPAARAGE